MRRILCAVSVVVAGTWGAAGAQSKSPVQIADYARLQSVGDVQLSPSGADLAYSVAANDRPGRPSSQHLAARHDLRRDRAARERLRAALVAGRQVDRLFRPHRGGQRPDRGRSPRRRASPGRANRQHQPSAAFVGRACGVVAGWPLFGIPVRHRGPGNRQRQRRPDGDHALPVQAHRRGRADPLQRQQAPAHLRGGRGLARGSSADERSSLRTLHQLVAEGRSDSVRLEPRSQRRQGVQLRHLHGHLPRRHRQAADQHQERRIRAGVVAGRHPDRVLGHDARAHLLRNDQGGHARVGDALGRVGQDRSRPVDRQPAGTTAVVTRRAAALLHPAGARQRPARVLAGTARPAGRGRRGAGLVG